MVNKKDQDEILKLVESILEYLYVILEASDVRSIDSEFIYPYFQYLCNHSNKLNEYVEFIKLSTILEKAKLKPWHSELIGSTDFHKKPESYLFYIFASSSSKYFLSTSVDKNKKNKTRQTIISSFKDILFEEYTILNIGAALEKIRVSRGFKLGQFRIGVPAKSDKDALSDKHFLTKRFDEKLKTVISISGIKIKRTDLNSIYFPVDSIEEELAKLKCIIIYLWLFSIVSKPSYYYYYTKSEYPSIFGFEYDRIYHKSKVDYRMGKDDREKLVRQSEIVKLKKYWPNFSKLLDNPRIRISSSRYLESAASKGPEDIIINHWIALESIFGVNVEISDRISTYYAYLTENRFEDRKKAKKMAKMHYAIRSAIVHGSKPGNLVNNLYKYLLENAGKYRGIMESPDLGEASNVSLIMLRRVFWALLADPNKLENMDDIVLGG